MGQITFPRKGNHLFAIHFALGLKLDFLFAQGSDFPFVEHAIMLEHSIIPRLEKRTVLLDLPGLVSIGG